MKSDPLTGPLYIGTGQTDNLSEIVKMMKLFQEHYPHVQFHLLSGDKETLLKQLEINLLDFVFLFMITIEIFMKEFL